MMRKLTVINTIMSMIFMVFILMLSGCGGSGLSGKYVNEANDSQYLEFLSSREVVLHGGEYPNIDGFYKIKGNILIISFNHGGFYSDDTFGLNSSKSTISYTGGSFTKEKGFWAKHWLKILIGWIILGLIVMAYEKITGREIS